MLHGYLSSAEIARASVAYWWRTTPSALKRISIREFRMMSEFMERIETAREEAREAARMGVPTPGRAPRGRPQSGDTVHDGRMDDRW